jgi:tRNA dimethylallyltransferase
LYKEHDVVIVCGGSGLFINTLVYGADPMPEADEELRLSLQQHFDEKGIEYLQEELLRLDPEYYKQVDKQNPLRLMRAIEVCTVTGQPYSAQRKSEKKERPFKTVFIGLDPGREELYNNINLRVDRMMKDGFLAEAHSLVQWKDLAALQTVGYRELFDYFEGNETIATAVELIKRNSRRYAKRQMTWFNRNEEIKWFNPADVKEIISYTEQQLSL